MHNLSDRLEKRGWAKSEIAGALSIIKKAKSQGAIGMFVGKSVYIALLFVLALANFVISVALLPVLVALNGISLYALLVLTGAIFGLLFELVIRSIEHLEKRHHLVLAAFIPLVALINAFAMSTLSNRFGFILGVSNVHNPWLISLLYSAAFVMPYLICRFVLKIEYYSR